MKKKILGRSDLHISRIGVGAWAIGGDWQWGWGEQDERDSIAAIHAALEQGCNWIDTAPIYGLGRSEEVIAKALKTTAYRPLLFTKCGLAWNGRGKIFKRMDRASLEREVDASLRRLNAEVIDLYQIHWPPEDDATLEEAWTTLVDLRERGKVRHIGVSNFSVAQLERIAAIAAPASLQPPYSLIAPQAAEALLPWCQAHGVGVINYSPMGSGLLSGKMTRERIDALPNRDWRKWSDAFKPPLLEQNLALVERLRAVGARHQCTAGAAAIAWTLRHPAIAGAIVGLRRADQVAEVARAAEIVWDDEDDALMDQARTD